MPLSTLFDGAFKVQIFDKKNKVIAEDNGSFFLSDLVPNNMHETKISQVNSVTVGA